MANQLGDAPVRKKDKEMEQSNLDSGLVNPCLLYTSPSPRDLVISRMPSSA